MQNSKPFPIPEPILVTGACGFIGRHLVDRLIQHGYEVRAFAMQQESFPRHWVSKVDVVRGDVKDPMSVERAMRGVKSLIHLVAKVGDWGEHSAHQQITVEGTKTLFDKALKHKVRTTLVSSFAVYTNNLQDKICWESQPHGKPLGPYSKSKQLQEHLALQYLRKGLEVAIVRPANVYGPGSEPWVHGVINQLKASKPSLINNGETSAGLVHVSNLVECLLRVAGLPQAIGEIYNACDEDSGTWHDYIHKLAKFANTPEPKSVPRSLAKPLTGVWEATWKLLRIKTRPALTFESLNLVSAKHQVPMKKAVKELRYAPVISYDEGMRQLAKYAEVYARNGEVGADDQSRSLIAPEPIANKA